MSSKSLPFSSADRDTLFPMIAGRVYADWTAAAVPPAHLIREHAEFLSTTLLGNPHSDHASSIKSKELINEARAAVLKYFQADPAEYDVIFTNNASTAILMLQHYMFDGGELLLTQDNHNTMNGLREIVKRQGGIVRYAPIYPDLSFHEQKLQEMLERPRTRGNRLFGYPAKSNYSGMEHPLSWIENAQSLGWDVCVDAATFLANNRLNLSRYKPEFVPLSFYKMFGFPTGLGALIVKKSVYPKLAKRWFSGGTILLVAVIAPDYFSPELPGPARWEDGTVNFQLIPSVTRGLRWLETLGDRTTHAVNIATRLYDRMRKLEVRGNRVKLHSPRGADTVTFSIAKQGRFVDAWLLERDADEHGVQFRTGCFCNPGANEKAMGYTLQEIEKAYHDSFVPEDFTLDQVRQNLGGKALGACRASFGYANIPEDADRIADWAQDYLERLAVTPRSAVAAPARAAGPASVQNGSIKMPSGAMVPRPQPAAAIPLPVGPVASVPTPAATEDLEPWNMIAEETILDS